MHVYLTKHARAAFAVLSEPQVATVLLPLVLAVSTLFLWWLSTRKLARAAVAAAQAAKTSADALMAAEQAQLFTVFDVGNIPQVLSELGKPERGEAAGRSGERIFVKFVCKNYGKSAAILREISHDLQHWGSLPTHLRYSPTPNMPKERALVGGGSSEPIECTMALPLTAAAATGIRAGESFLWAFGRVLYDDAFGREREHRFLCRYRVGYGFQPYDYKDYNKNT